MRKGNLSKVESMNCDFTNRIQADGGAAVEFSTDINFVDKDGRHRTLTAHYYQDPEDDVIGEIITLEWTK